LLFAYAVAPRSGISIPASECTVSAAYGKVQSTLVSAVEAGEAIMPGAGSYLEETLQANRAAGGPSHCETADDFPRRVDDVRS
jgi:hypothetical protein